MKRHILRLDHQITASMQQWPAFLRPVMQLASFFGLPIVAAALVTLGVWSAFGLTNDRVTVALFLCFVACGLTMVLKMVLQRERPQTIYAKNMWFKTYSFPSGHTLSSVVLYGFAAYLAGQYWVGPLGSWLATSLLLTIVLVGVSRIYLGAHYLLDVVAGLLLGSAMLWLIIALVQP